MMIQVQAQISARRISLHIGTNIAITNRQRACVSTVRWFRLINPKQKRSVWTRCTYGEIVVRRRH